MEKRAVPRISLNASVRLRAAGSIGPGWPCRAVDSSSHGVRFECLEAPDAGWEWIEILPYSADAATGSVHARVVRAEDNAQGYREIGCTFV